MPKPIPDHLWPQCSPCLTTRLFHSKRRLVSSPLRYFLSPHTFPSSSSHHHSKATTRFYEKKKKNNIEEFDLKMPFIPRKQKSKAQTCLHLMSILPSLEIFAPLCLNQRLACFHFTLYREKCSSVFLEVLYWLLQTFEFSMTWKLNNKCSVKGCKELTQGPSSSH